MVTMKSMTAAFDESSGHAPVVADSFPDSIGDLRLLILDEPAGDKWALDALLAAGATVASQRVDTEKAYARALIDFDPQIVLVSATLSPYGGEAALRLVQRLHPRIPVIMICDRGPAEESFELVRAGARNCIYRDDWTRLVPAVRGALRWARERRTNGRNEETLRKSEIRYRRLFEEAKDGILIVDADSGRILDANPYMTDQVEYSHEEYVGKYLWEIGAFADIVASQAAFQKLREIRYIRYDNLPLRAKSGRLLEVEFISNVYAEDGYDTIQCNIRDITERKLVDKKLFQAQKMAAVGILTGGIAHNINNLLSIVIGNIELLQERIPNDAQGAQFGHEAIAAALRGSALIRHLLAFAREQPLRPQRLDINELIPNVARTLRALLGEGVEVSVDLGGGALWPVQTDTAQLEASLLNLAVNARDAMPRGGRIRIATCNRHLDVEPDLVEPVGTPGDFVEISVTDNGSGSPRT